MEAGCSHDVAGICLGSIYIGFSIVGFMYSMIYFAELVSRGYADGYEEAIWLILSFSLIALISFLFVLAIEMRRPFLILPWLVFSLYVSFITISMFCAIMELSLDYHRNIYFILYIILVLIVAFVVTVTINSIVLFVKICREYKRNKEDWDALKSRADKSTIV